MSAEKADDSDHAPAPPFGWFGIQENVPAHIAGYALPVSGVCLGPWLVDAFGRR